jgi:hypothetical protein
MTTREIQGHLEEIYQVEESPTLISNVTEAVIEEVKAWQGRLLEPVYPIVYLDALVVKMRSEGRVENRAVYLAIGITMEGRKEVLGLWTSANEGAKFWLQVLTELKNRGIEDIFIACVDGLKGFPQAIETVFPKTTVQLCIVHSVCTSAASVSDVHMLPDLLHGAEKKVWGDAGYQGQTEAIHAVAPEAQDMTSRRAKRKDGVDEVERRKNRTKARVRSKVEWPFRILKRVFGYTKVRYRGLKKNHEWLLAAFALVNLYQHRKRLAPLGA